MNRPGIKAYFAFSLMLVMDILACSFGQMPALPTGPEADAAATAIFLPLVSTQPASGGTLMTDDFEYLGAFRLPGGEDRPQTFAYGGNAMTFNPEGDQRRARIGDVSYDRQSGLLYVLELYADGAKPVVHVWRVR